MKKLLCMLALLAALMLMVAGCLAESGNDVLLQHLIDQYDGFLNGETTQQIPIYYTDDYVGMLVFCSGEARSGLMLENSITIEVVGKEPFNRSAYDAGEGVVNHLNMLYMLSQMLQTTGDPAPADTGVMGRLLSDCGGSISIAGFDSAYASGEASNEQGRNVEWEVYPFCVAASDGSPFEHAAYIYFQILYLEEECNGLCQLIIADQENVCTVLEHMLNLLPDITQEDRELMLLFIEYNRALAAQEP